ncbi:MAG: SdrD B-like domain-containing protein, partial [Acidobacteriota bacterium]
MKPSMIFVTALGLAATLLTSTAVGQEPTPVGSEFRVDDLLITNGRLPAVTITTDGDFVIVWESSLSLGDDTNYGSLQGKRFTSDGAPLFNQVQLNSYTPDGIDVPDVAPLPDGGFVAVWEGDSAGNDNSSNSIQFRRFDRDGNGLAPQYQVNTYTPNDQEEPRVASAADGSFVVVWRSLGGAVDTSLQSVQGQRFDSVGQPAGQQFRVNTSTTSGQKDPAIAARPDGSFVVVWNSGVSGGTDIGSYSIQGQRYASDGSPIAAEFQVNTYTPNRQEYPDIAVAPDGRFVVVWKSYGSFGSDNDQNSIQGQRFAPDGSRVGAQFQVNTTTVGNQDDPRVGIADDGSFTVVWHSNNTLVSGQSFASDGTFSGAEFVINAPTSFSQRDVVIAADGAGDFLVTWDFGAGLKARRFRSTADIGDRVWQDLDRNGLQDADEPGVEGVTVILLDNLSQVVGNTVTDADGRFLFSQVDPGAYFLSFVKLDPFDEFTTTNAGDDLLDSDVGANGNTAVFTIAAGDTDLSLDAGLLRRSLGDRVWRDADGDGIQDGNELGAAGATIFLLDENFVSVDSTTTAEGGIYGFAGVEPGRYFLSVLPPAGFDLTAQNQGADDTVDSDADPVSRATPLFDVVDGQVDLSLDFGLVSSALVGDQVWFDADRDGVQDVGEAGATGIAVQLFSESGALQGSAMTNAEGAYIFFNIGPGTYYVRITPPAGFGFTTPNQGSDDALDSDIDPQLFTSPPFTVAPGELKRDIDGGLIPAASVDGLLWRDADLDGVRDGGEPRISGVTVELFNDGGASRGTTLSAADGSYSFTGLAAGSYYVSFSAPTGFYLTAQDQGSDDTVDSDADPFTATTAPFALADGQVESHVDAGLVGEGSIGDRVWFDEDRDGIQDVGEADADGVDVELFDASGLSQGTTTTALDGSYSFANVGPGTYYVNVTAPAGFGFTAQNQGSDDRIDSDIDPRFSNSPLFELAAGEARSDLDAGLIPAASVEGRAWIDLNGDGIQGPEPGLSGVLIELLDTDFVSFGQVTTGGDGSFAFPGLPAGTYFMAFSAPAGFFPTLQDQGNDEAADSDLDPETGTTALFELVEGQVETSLDAGFVGEGSIGDRVFIDTDRDGIFDVGE